MGHQSAHSELQPSTHAIKMQFLPGNFLRAAHGGRVLQGCGVDLAGRKGPHVLVQVDAAVPLAQYGDLLVLVGRGQAGLEREAGFLSHGDGRRVADIARRGAHNGQRPAR